MSSNPGCAVYVGNLDERVSDRVLYDILIQAGRVVDLHIPRDRETDRPKGYAFAEYESEEIANYAVKLFSGLVTLYNRTLKFAISGRDKVAQNNPNLGKASNGNNTNLESINRSLEVSPQCRVSANPHMNNSLVPPGITHKPGSHYNGVRYDNGRRDFGGFGSPVDTNSRPRLRRYDTSRPLPFSSY